MQSGNGYEQQPPVPPGADDARAVASAPPAPLPDPFAAPVAGMAPPAAAPVPQAPAAAPAPHVPAAAPSPLPPVVAPAPQHPGAVPPPATMQPVPPPASAPAIQPTLQQAPPAPQPGAAVLAPTGQVPAPAPLPGPPTLNPPPPSQPPVAQAPAAPPAQPPAAQPPSAQPPAAAPRANGQPPAAAPPANGLPPVATPPAFRGASSMQLQGKKLRIGELLIDMGMLDPGQLEHALSIQKQTGQRLGKVLISEGIVSSTDIAKALARRLSIEYVDLNELSLDNHVLSLIPLDVCKRYDIVPIGEAGDSLLIAMADPTNVFALDDLRLVTGRDIRVVVGTPEAIDVIVSRMFNLDDAVSGAVAQADDWEDEHVPLEDIKNSEADAPAVSLVNQIITKAVVDGVSDLHFEPQSDDMVVRFRKDGVLHHVTSVPGKLRNGVTSRLKIMASLDISERRKPQDGRVGLRVGEKPIDLRVATLPTVYGEKAVLRVLDKSNVMLDMTDLGFLPPQLEKLRHCYTQPYGCLLVTGPTGSGKSTTLYGALNEVNDVQKNIITVEDPVEYRLRGINQVQVNNKAGLSFGAALKSILRCDPDIVMIGEMRDHETASIGIEAALTGHLVLSTLHTNTAPGAITRLTEMGIEPYLVSSSVLGVLAQRLARRLCKCANEYQPTKDELVAQKFPEWALEQFEREPFTLRRPSACERCQGKGYKGRMGLHEVMLMSEEIAQLAIQHASAEEIANVAIRQGMLELWDDGVHKIIMGQTTMDELQRIVQH